MGHGLGMSSTVHEIVATKLSTGLHIAKAIWSDRIEEQAKVVIRGLFGLVDINLNPART